MADLELQNRALRLALSILRLREQVPPQNPEDFLAAFTSASRRERLEQKLSWIDLAIMQAWMNRFLTPADTVVRMKLEETLCKSVVHTWYAALHALGYDYVELPTHFEQ